jgi:hypothetical protein
MKTLAPYLLALVVAFGAPAALAQQATESAEPVVEPQSEEDTHSPQERVLSQKPEQALYKGVVGNLLEAVPMDAGQRVGLQRANAIVGTPFSVRSAALLLGIANPVVMIGGLIWGIWAASQIENPKTADKVQPVLHRDDLIAAVAGD